MAPFANSFEICITGPSYLTPNCKTITTAQVANGDKLLWINLIPGAYTIVETPQAEWTTVVTSSPTTVLDDGSKATASVSNTLKLGSLTVTKNIVWSNVNGDPSKIFEICIKGPSYPLGTEAGACKQFSMGNLVQTWTNLIPGDYQISEKDPGIQWTVTIQPGIVTVLSGANPTATVTNKQYYLAYTPGFWKNHGPLSSSGNNAWQYTDYATSDLAGMYFNIPSSLAMLTPKGQQKSYDELTLLDALGLRGGKGFQGAVDILLRHGTAALLNASINEAMAGMGYAGFGAYPYSTQEIIILVNNALASGDRNIVLSLASALDKINNDGSEYFDWNWPVPNKVTALNFQWSLSNSLPWNGSAVPGALKKGYTLDINGTGYYYLNVTGMTVAPSQVKDGLYGFYLKSYFPVGATAANKPAMLAYWATRGVTAAATPGSWQAVMWQIINGAKPIFYLEVKNGATTFMLQDGLQKELSVVDFLRVNGDYLLGSYTYSGMLTSQDNSNRILAVGMTFK